MIEWLTTIIDAIQTNQIVAGIFGTTIFAGLATYFRNIPMQIFNKIYNFFTVTIIFDQQNKANDEQWSDTYVPNQAYLAIINYLSKQKIYTFKRTFDCISDSIHRDSPLKTPEIKFIGSLGTIYWSMVNNILISFQMTENKEGRNKRTFFISIRFFTRNKNHVEEIIEDLIKKYLESEKEIDQVKYFYNNYNDWHWTYKENQYSQNIFILNSVQEEIYQKIGKFLNSKVLYRQLCKPYHTGFIFYGDPGCGKSQFIKKIAEDFFLPIYILNIACIKSDSTLIQIIQQIRHENAIVLIEDVDRFSFTGSYKTKRELSKREIDANNLNKYIETGDDSNFMNPDYEKNEETFDSISFSTFLNVIDGIYGTDSGLIFIATTNHIDKLDPAFIRPGRFDYLYEFKPMNTKEICNFISIQYNSKEKVELRKDLSLPISIVSNMCFECSNIQECSEKLNNF